jgi:predicted transcriptional regulator
VGSGSLGDFDALAVWSRGMADFLRMSDKDVVIETLRQMPEAATLEQISDEIAILAAIRKGEAAADAGQVTPHQQVRQKLASWISK